MINGLEKDKDTDKVEGISQEEPLFKVCLELEVRSLDKSSSKYLGMGGTMSSVPNVCRSLVCGYQFEYKSEDVFETLIVSMCTW